MDILKLRKKHPLYQKYEENWKLFKISYEGGREYENARLLYMYGYERKSKDGTDRYNERLMQTPLDNQCKSCIHTYSALVWRKKPQRYFAGLENNPELLAMLEDSDKAGTSIDEFMRQVQIDGHIYGNTWIVIDKSAKQYKTLAHARKDAVRPYMINYNPLDVWDWDYERQDDGEFKLTYLKVCENDYDREGHQKETIRVWTTDSVESYVIVNDKIEDEGVAYHKLGIIPAVCHYSRKRIAHGVGDSEIDDIVKMQMSIYNDLSELTQTIRNTTHNTLVKNQYDDVSTGAGGVIIMDDNTQAEKKPYLLKQGSDQVLSIIKSIEKKTDMINWMTFLSTIKSSINAAESAEAMKMQFHLLNALLNEISGQLQLTERKLMKIFLRWLGKDNKYSAISIMYPMKFELRDTESDLRILEVAKGLDVKSSEYKRQIDKQITAVTLEDDEQLELIYEEIDKAKYQIEQQ